MSKGRALACQRLTGGKAAMSPLRGPFYRVVSRRLSWLVGRSLQTCGPLFQNCSIWRIGEFELDRDWREPMTLAVPWSKGLRLRRRTGAEIGTRWRARRRLGEDVRSRGVIQTSRGRAQARRGHISTRVPRQDQQVMAIARELSATGRAFCRLAGRPHITDRVRRVDGPFGRRSMLDSRSARVH